MRNETEHQIAELGERTSVGSGVATGISGIIAWGADTATQFGDFATSALGLAFFGFVVSVASALASVYFRRRDEKRAMADESRAAAREVREAQLHMARMRQMLGDDWQDVLKEPWDE